jgi:hypothetical protein
MSCHEHDLAQLKHERREAILSCDRPALDRLEPRIRQTQALCDAASVCLTFYQPAHVATLKFVRDHLQYLHANNLSLYWERFNRAQRYFSNPTNETLKGIWVSC